MAVKSVSNLFNKLWEKESSHKSWQVEETTINWLFSAQVRKTSAQIWALYVTDVRFIGALHFFNLRFFSEKIFKKYSSTETSTSCRLCRSHKRLGIVINGRTFSSKARRIVRDNSIWWSSFQTWNNIRFSIRVIVSTIRKRSLAIKITQIEA